MLEISFLNDENSLNYLLDDQRLLIHWVRW